MQRDYNGLIFTNHAIERMRQRRIKQGDAYATFKRADLSKKASTPGGYVYYRRWGNRQIEVVTKKNDRGEWVVLSVWDKDVNRMRENGPEPKSFWRTLFYWIKKLIIG
jgi:hypothetical protein